MRKRKDSTIWFQEARKVADDPAASGWLKNALVEAINRDPLNAAADAEVLARILLQRAAAVQYGTNSNASSRPPKTVS